MEAPIENFPVYNQGYFYTKADGNTSTIEVPLFEIPAGTLLFRGVQLPNPKKDEDPRMFVRDWLGYPRGDRFCLTPTHNTFFYTSPFVPFGAHTVGEWFNAVMVYQLVQNVRVVAMIGPSKWVRGGKELKTMDGEAPIQRCDKLDYSCIEDKSSKEAKKEKIQQSWDNCIHPKFARLNKVSGWMAIADYDSLDNFKEALKGKDTTMGKYIMELEGRLPGKGIDLLTSTYTDASKHRGFPEIVLYPWAPHPGEENQYTEARTEEDAADAIAEMSDRFTYLPIACITERGILEAFTGDFKASDLPAYAASAAPGPLTRKNIDKLQAAYLEKLQKGIDIPGFGPCQLLFDCRTGFYVMNRFTGMLSQGGQLYPYSQICLPLKTQEEQDLVLQYKIRYRSFDPFKLLQTNTFIDETTQVPRLFVFERPDELYPQFKELGLRLPSRFIPYIWGATERFQLDLADRRERDDPRGAEEARRRAAEAKKKIQESLDFIAKKKAEREGKKTGKASAKATEEVAAAEHAAAVEESKTPEYAPKTPEFTPSRLTGVQTSIPIVRTMQEALAIGREAFAQAEFAKDYPLLSQGMNPRVGGPWELKPKVLERTLKYIYEFMHHTCYMLCVNDGRPYLFKLEGSGLPAKVRTILQQQMAERDIRDIDLDNTRIMQCIIKPYQQDSTTATEWLDFLQGLVSDGLKLPNGVFILNLTDALMLRTDDNDPFGFFTKRLEKLPDEYANRYYLPILSYSGNKFYEDIPIPNFDDLFTIQRNADGSVNVEGTLGGEVVSNWSEKQDRAVFRGGTTGCGYTPETNSRLLLVDYNFVQGLENADMLDVGITTITKQYKMDPENGLGRVDPESVYIVTPMTMAQQSNYKYIIHIDGNVFAYRFLKSMLTGSLVLREVSNYEGWMDRDKTCKGLAIYEDTSDLTNRCYLTIAPKLGNLDEVLTWIQENDEICKQIAANGKAYALKALSKQYLYTSFTNILNAVVALSKVEAANGGSRQKQTRKHKASKAKKTRKQSKRSKEDPLVLSHYRGAELSDSMGDYISSTMRNLWERFAKRPKSVF
jgi:hypothetical protein